MRAIVTTVLTIAIGATTATAPAQTWPNPGVAAVTVDRPSSGYQSTALLAPIIPGRWNETPTTRRQQLGWAVALHEEALRFRAEDGGTISDRHAAYLRNRAAKLLRP
jgi:hypothetical protein